MEWWEEIAGGKSFGKIPPVSGITLDSRLVEPGWAFVAVPGLAADGHDFLDEAADAGAAALVVEEGSTGQWTGLIGRLPILVVADTRAAVGPLAAAVHDHPSAALCLVGITGTDGKTTTTHLAAHVLQTCGIESGYLSSVGFETGSGLVANISHMTTLEAPVIQSFLAQAEKGKRQTMVIEASSEGLAQHRLSGCEFDIAVFTNLTRDHLNFHHTMERYLAAKGLLFEMTEKSNTKGFPKWAVLNNDDPASRQLRELTRLPSLSYGMSSGSDLQATEVEGSNLELRFKTAYSGREFEARVPLIGEFNAYNCLAAAAVAVSRGIDAESALAALESFPGVPGRLERIARGQPFNVFIDIASTPAALENVLNALRPGTSGRLWAVFGAAGGRDPARRGGMGRVAGRLADRVVLTNEDPRDEDPEAIIAEIADGMSEAGRRRGADFFERPDRQEAIQFAFSQAAAGDTVLLAGKATETTMVFGRESRVWNERAIVLQILAAAQ